MIEKLIDWYMSLIERIQVAVAARFLFLKDEGWCGDKYHLICGTPMRYGSSQVLKMRVRWCYRCQDSWPHEQDGGDDDGPRRKSLPPKSPNDRFPDATKEYEKLLARLRERSRLVKH